MEKKLLKILIFANGEPPDLELMRRLADDQDLVIVTDGAARIAAEFGLKVDIISGDFDSIDLEIAEQRFPEAEFIHTPDQDMADLEKAILIALERGATSISLVGATGGRIDHALSNFSLMLKYCSQTEMSCHDNGMTIYALHGTSIQPAVLSIHAVPGEIISIVSLDGDNLVSLTGVKWDLHSQSIGLGTNGVSNVAISKNVLATVLSGRVLICHLLSL